MREVYAAREGFGMRYLYLDAREGLKRGKIKRNAATRPSFGFCPNCGRYFFGGGVCRRCRKAAHIVKGQGVRHV